MCLSQQQRLAAAAKQVVQISTAKPEPRKVALTPGREPKAEKAPKQRPPRKVFHCEICGHTGPHSSHVCPGPRMIAYVRDRGHQCSTCSYAAAGVCTLEKSAHPDRDCIIETGIQMPEAYCKAGKWDRVLYRCPACHSETFNEMGANRCKHCGHGAPLKVSLPYRIVVQAEPPLEAARDLAVITIAGGQQSLELLEITGPRMQAYAERCGADFHAITTNVHPTYPLANKFRLRSLAANYKRVLFLDVDIWVRDGAANLFDSPSGCVWMHVDYPYLASKGWVKGESELAAKEQGVPPIRLQVLNTGVVLFDREHLDLWTPPPLPAKPRHLTEQTWVEYNLARLSYPLGLLETSYNTQWWMPAFKELEPQAKFVHLANCPHEERIYRLRKYQWEEKRGSKAVV
ncbi:MAG: hypothetical protein ACO1RT_20420 [Planctomycetaceae bacterium]